MEDTSLLLPGERLDDVNFRVRLIQKPTGLTFGTDALLLAAALRGTGKERAVELGGGSGIVSCLALARGKFAHIDCVEIQPAYADLIRRNAALNGFSDRLTSVCVDVRDHARAGREQGQADRVFANPPYMTGSGLANLSPEKQTARHETCGGILDFTACASRLLRYGGAFTCVYRPDRLDDLLAALRDAALTPKRLTLIHADQGTPPSLLLLEATKGGGQGLFVTRPLFLYREKGDRTHYSDDMQTVYDTGTLPLFYETR